MLQLAFAFFQWEDWFEHDIEARRVAANLTALFPSDPDILFWASYITYITTTHTPFTDATLRKALALDPHHPYANLVMAGHLYESDKPRAVEHLRRTLASQPGNARALAELAELSLALGRNEDALEAARTILGGPKFVEDSLGCFNDYANDVLIQANQTEIRIFAQEIVDSGGNPARARRLGR